MTVARTARMSNRALKSGARLSSSSSQWPRVEPNGNYSDFI